MVVKRNYFASATTVFLLSDKINFISLMTPLASPLCHRLSARVAVAVLYHSKSTDSAQTAASTTAERDGFVAK